MKKIIVLMLLLSTLGSIAQSYQENLEKYWYYRHKLKEEFMYFSSNPNDLGSHMPAECSSDTIIPNNQGENYSQHYIRWGDGTWWLGHYMAVLALEYRLLKDNGQDYAGTLNELNQALIAYDRLDSVIETCFDNGISEWNGFFARDDVPISNNQYFPSSAPNIESLYVSSDYRVHCDSTDGNVPSQDQIISLFLGLRLVNELVSESYIKDKAQEIAGAVIDRMHHSYDLFGIGIEFEIWEIKNPVTGNVVPTGGDFFSLYPQIWAIAEAAGNITYQDEHEFYSDFWQTKEVWDNVQNTILMHFDEGTPLTIPIWIGVPILGIPPMFFGVYNFYGSPYNAYMISVLSTLCNEPGGGYSNTYEWLVNFSNDTQGFLGMPNNVGLYPYLPLINRILYGYEGNNLIAANEYETKFLNNSPPCGSHHYVYQNNGDTIDEVTSPPWHTISLGCPQHNSGGWRFDGEYNMIDYMILYNAYFLNYLYGSYIPYILDTGEYPVEVLEYDIVYDINGYPDTIWYEYTNYTCSEPKIFNASRQIDSKAFIDSVGGIQYTAGSSIRLLPDFKVNSGGCFKAQIHPAILQEFYYNETNVNTCMGGTFTPLAYTDDKQSNQEMIHKLSSKNIDSQNKQHIQRRNANTLKNDDAFSYNEHKVVMNNMQTYSQEGLYPNPSNGKFTLSTRSIIQSIIVHNSFGECVLNIDNINEKTITFDISNQPLGVYYLVVIGIQKTKTYRIIKI